MEYIRVTVHIYICLLNEAKEFEAMELLESVRYLERSVRILVNFD